MSKELKFSLVKLFISKQTLRLLYSSLHQCNAELQNKNRHKYQSNRVSFVSSPTYALSKHLARALSPLVGNSSLFVSSSSVFVSFSKSITIPEKYELVSFDVVSLSP